MTAPRTDNRRILADSLWRGFVVGAVLEATAHLLAWATDRRPLLAGFTLLFVWSVHATANYALRRDRADGRGGAALAALFLAALFSLLWLALLAALRPDIPGLAAFMGGCVPPLLLWVASHERAAAEAKASGGRATSGPHLEARAYPGDIARVALPSVLHRFEVQLSHVDRGIEQSLSVSAARHPSETLERLWLRLIAWLWQWEEGIAFGPGLCEPDEPDAFVASPRGGFSLLVRVGKPEPERIDREVSRNSGAKVAVLFESPKRLQAFVEEARGLGLTRAGRAELAAVEPAFLAALAADDARRAKVSVTIVGDHVYVVDATGRTAESPLHRGSI